MLAYILALAVGISSSILFTKALLSKELQRESKFWQTDIFWGGIGLFYALDLWLCAGRITGAVLLGQIASVSLIGWLGWQTLTMRRTLEKLGSASDQEQVASETVDKPKISATESAETTKVQEAEIVLPETKKEKGFSLGKVIQPIANIFGKGKAKTELTLGSIAQELEEVEEVLETVEVQVETVKEAIGEEKETEESELVSEETETATVETEAEVATEFTRDETEATKLESESSSEEVETGDSEAEVATEFTRDETEASELESESSSKEVETSDSEAEVATEFTRDETEATESVTEVQDTPIATTTVSEGFESKLDPEFIDLESATEFAETTETDDTETEATAEVVSEEIATEITREEEDKLEVYLDLADEYPLEPNIAPPESKSSQPDEDTENPPAQT